MYQAYQQFIYQLTNLNMAKFRAEPNRSKIGKHVLPHSSQLFAFKHKGKTILKSFILLLFTILSTIGAHAAGIEASEASPSTDIVQNIFWVITATVLVFFMQAGFALLESGSVRTKNTVNVMMKNYLDVCVGSLIFFVVGYGLLMGNNPTGFIGTSHFFPSGLTDYEWSVMLFQMMFAATAVTIASGAMAERVKFISYVISAILICGFIYPIFASWVWGGAHGGEGWLAKLGFIDFAGSTVVHSIGGWIALAGVLVMGPRMGRFGPDGNIREIPGHNLTLVALGGFILWFGWFGFNAGSTLGSSDNLGLISLNTQLSATAACCGLLIFQGVAKKPILLSDTINVSLTGLVAITAGCATMSPIFAIVTGLIAALVYKFGVKFLQMIKVDDVVNASVVHGFGGAWGTIAAGMFYNGDLFNVSRIAIQVLGVGVAILWAFGLAWVIYSILNKTIGLKASLLHEQRGLDYTEHTELGYPEFQQSLFSQENMQNRR